MIARDCVDVCFLLTQFRRKAPTDDTFRMEQLALCVGVGLGGVLCREPIGRAPLTHLPARMCSLLCLLLYGRFAFLGHFLGFSLLAVLLLFAFWALVRSCWTNPRDGRWLPDRGRPLGSCRRPPRGPFTTRPARSQVAAEPEAPRSTLVMCRSSHAHPPPTRTTLPTRTALSHRRTNLKPPRSRPRRFARRCPWRLARR